jgi:SAM-dependent methyltransferase
VAETILNLGCGTRTSPRAVNIDWSIYLRARRSRLGRVVAPLLLRGARREAFANISGDIVVHDLRKGIPAASNSVDAVYHCHVLEHIDRDAVPDFFAEVLRVLRPGGIHRIVVPDLEAHMRLYRESLEAGNPNHDQMIDRLIGQMVRREALGTSRQPPFRRVIENLVLGDARKRGETHQWWWDRLNLQHALEEAGFLEVASLGPTESRISGWSTIGLDTDPDGAAYKPDSLWVEAAKPQ